MSRGVRHAFAARAGIDWRSRPDLDTLQPADFLAIIRDAWTPERRTAASAAAVAAWRADHPERATVRDAILAGSTQEPCDRCGAEAARLFVTDYATADHVWRCAPCASAARAEYRHHPEPAA